MSLSINSRTTPEPSSFRDFETYAKDLQLHHKFSSMELAEAAAEMFGYVLVPASCLSWRKRNSLGETRRIKINESFYAVRVEELTDLERNKFFKYCDNLKEVYR